MIYKIHRYWITMAARMFALINFKLLIFHQKKSIFPWLHTRWSWCTIISGILYFYTGSTRSTYVIISFFPWFLIWPQARLTQIHLHDNLHMLLSTSTSFVRNCHTHEDRGLLGYLTQGYSCEIPSSKYKTNIPLNFSLPNLPLFI